MTQPDVQAVLVLRRRYRAYLEKQTHVSFAQRYGAAIALGSLGLFFLIGAIAFASGAGGGITVGVACIVFAIYSAQKNAPRTDSRMTVAQTGLPVWGVLVQANHLLFQPGERNLPCLVLFSFEPAKEE